MDSPTTITVGHNWTPLICQILLVFGTLVGTLLLLPSVGKPCIVCVFE